MIICYKNMDNFRVYVDFHKEFNILMNKLLSDS